MEKIEKGSELYLLIQSLDDRERLLYRRMAGQNLRNGKNTYLTLFNALAAMEVYDEAVLEKKLKDPVIVKHLKTHQTRLFDQLTEFLRYHDEFPGSDAQLNAACERVAILKQRGLFASAKRELKKAQSIALKHENYVQLLRMADLERSFFFTETSKNVEAFKDALQFRDREFLASLHNQVNLKMLHMEALFLKKSGAGKKAQIATLGAMVQEYCGDPIVKRIKEAKPTTTDIMLLDTIGVWSLLEGDFDRAYLAYNRMDALWVSDPEFISENASLYVGFITSFLNACLVSSRWIEFRILLSNVKTVKLTKEVDAFMLEEALLYLEIIYCLNRGEIEKGLAIVPDAERLLNRHRGRIPQTRVIAFCFNVCSLHFMKGQYSKANRWLVRLLNMPNKDYRRDVLDFAPIFQLLLFVAMGDRELLATRLRARQRARKGESSSQLEAMIMDFANKYVHSADSEYISLVSQFSQDLQYMLETSTVPFAGVGVGESIFWADATLQGKVPGEILREQVAKT